MKTVSDWKKKTELNEYVIMFKCILFQKHLIVSLL